jgi:capsular exopolysaccharide synthesis family protein
MDLRSYCRMLRRRWVVLLGTFLLVGAALGGAGFLIPSVYTATAQMVFAPNLPADATMETRHTAELYLAGRMKTYAQVVTTDSVLQPVIDNLRLGVTVPELVEKLEVRIPADTSVIDLEVSAPTAAEAAAIANNIAGQMQLAVVNLEGAASVIQVAVLQPATPPSHRSSPNGLLNLAVAGVLAVLAGVFAAVIADIFDTRVRKGRDVTALGVPYLGGIPKVRGAKARDLLPFAEQAPRLQTVFHRIAVDVLDAVGERPACVLVTSPRAAAAGKTMAGANIAGALAEGGNRVAFIDADVRGGLVAAQAGITQTRGITDLVSGRVGLDGSFFDSKWGGITVVPLGESAFDIGQLLSSKQFEDVMRDFAGHFDAVIVDAPPITNLNEASRFTQNISNVVVVAEAANTRRDELMRVTGLLRETGAKILGVVLTQAHKAEKSAPADNADRHDEKRSDHVNERPRHGR